MVAMGGITLPEEGVWVVTVELEIQASVLGDVWLVSFESSVGDGSNSFVIMSKDTFFKTWSFIFSGSGEILFEGTSLATLNFTGPTADIDASYRAAKLTGQEEWVRVRQSGGPHINVPLIVPVLGGEILVVSGSGSGSLGEGD